MQRNPTSAKAISDQMEKHDMEIVVQVFQA
jgi:hypothetical protein